MDFSVALGVDDLTLRASDTEVREAREAADAEIERICQDYQSYRQGEQGSWLVPAERLLDRLDAKHCIPLQGRFVEKWEKAGHGVQALRELEYPFCGPAAAVKCEHERCGHRSVICRRHVEVCRALNAIVCERHPFEPL